MAATAQDVSSFAPPTVSSKVASTSTSSSALWMGDESRATDNRQDIPQSVLLDMHGTLASLFGSDHKRASFYTHQYGKDKRTPDNVVHLPRDKIMPKGIFHSAKTADGFDVSTHITIGLQESS